MTTALFEELAGHVRNSQTSLGGHLGMSSHEERRYCEEAIADEAIQNFLSISSGLPRRCAARNDDFLV
jgi:hypothetical protein